MRTKLWAIGLIVFCTFLVASAQLMLKTGMKNFSLDISILTNYVLIAGVLLYFIGAALLVVALKNGELSVLYPLFAMSYVWVSLLSPMFFPADSMNPEKWIGIFIIISGSFFIGRGANSNGD